MNIFTDMMNQLLKDLKKENIKEVELVTDSKSMFIVISAKRWEHDYNTGISNKILNDAGVTVEQFIKRINVSLSK